MNFNHPPRFSHHSGLVNFSVWEPLNMAVRIGILLDNKIQGRKGCQHAHDLGFSMFFHFPPLVPLQPTSHKPRKTCWIKNKERLILNRTFPETNSQRTHLKLSSPHQFSAETLAQGGYIHKFGEFSTMLS